MIDNPIVAHPDAARAAARAVMHLWRPTPAVSRWLLTGDLTALADAHSDALSAARYAPRGNASRPGRHAAWAAAWATAEAIGSRGAALAAGDGGPGGRAIREALAASKSAVRAALAALQTQEAT